MTIFSWSPLRSQQLPDGSPITVGNRIDLPSLHLGQTRQLYVRLPDNYEDTGAVASRYPVLYLLDGGDYFEPLAGIVEYMTMYEMIPELIVVGVSQGDRMSDLTFSASNKENGDWPTSGGGEQFLAFLEEELIPAIDESYRTHPFRILIGHSLGGLFAVECLSRRPDLFQAILAFSPSVYWNQFEWLKSTTSLFDGLHPWRQFLFISDEQKGEEETRRLDEFQSLVESRAPAEFEYHFSSYPDENHASVALPAFYDNLRQLFDGWTLEQEGWELGPAGIQAHFRALSDRYGFSVSIPEDYLVAHALHGLQRHDAPREAIALLELCLSLYPRSADAHVALGEVYESLEDRDEARRQYRRALEIAPDHEGAAEGLKRLVSGT